MRPSHWCEGPQGPAAAAPPWRQRWCVWGQWATPAQGPDLTSRWAMVPTENKTDLNGFPHQL